MIARDILSICEEIENAITSLDDIKVGDWVKFVKGHYLEGIVGLVQNIEKDGTISVRIGGTVKIGIPKKDIIKISGHPGIGNEKV